LLNSWVFCLSLSLKCSFSFTSLTFTCGRVMHRVHLFNLLGCLLRISFLTSLLMWTLHYLEGSKQLYKMTCTIPCTDSLSALATTALFSIGIFQFQNSGSSERQTHSRHISFLVSRKYFKALKIWQSNNCQREY
jgi:hypothetical protein